MLFSVMMLALAAEPARDSVPVAQVALDRSKREVVVTAGPFNVPSMPPGMKHEEMDMMADHSTPVIRFEWPVEGWFRGFSIEIVDAAGKPIDRRLVHHLIAINFDRRQLLYPSYERIFGIGQETEDAFIPKSIGIPMKPATKLGMYLAWANETGKDLEGVQVRLKLAYSPNNLNPRPLDALPIYMDVNLTVGKGNTYDIPAGKSEKSWEFTPPVSGRLLVLSWGGTYGACSTAVAHAREDGASVAHCHLRYLNPFPSNLGKVLSKYKKVLVPEMNLGQLLFLLRAKFLVDAKGVNKVQGKPFRVSELIEVIEKECK